MTAICPACTVCVCVCEHTLAGTIMFLLVGAGVQVAVYCNIAPPACNSTGDVGALQTMLVIKTHSEMLNLGPAVT